MSKLLVVDPITDARETAQSITVYPMTESGPDKTKGETITDQTRIRALYEHPSASAYGEGSYVVEDAN
jgi:hypothetical protein